MRFLQLDRSHTGQTRAMGALGATDWAKWDCNQPRKSSDGCDALLGWPINQVAMDKKGDPNTAFAKHACV